MNRLKICLITDTWFPIIGGGPQVVVNYAKQLAVKHGCNVDIITRRFNQQDNYPVLRSKKIKIIRIGPGLPWNNNYSRLIFIIIALRCLLRKDYDIVHAFPFIAGFSVWFYHLFTKKPVIFSVFALKSQYRRLFFDLAGGIELFIATGLKYNLLITDNQEFAGKFKRNIVYIANGVDIKLFNAVIARKEGFPRLIYVGRFHPQKGITVLIKAIKSLIVRFPKIKLILIGYGSEKKKIEELILNLNLTANIEIKPPLIGVKLIKEYKKSHLLVLPSLYEGQGIVVLEAWASGIPVVASKAGSLKYLVKEGQNGYLVKPNNPQQLALKISKALVGNNLQKMGINGFNLVKNYYTWEKAGDQLFKQYQQLLN